MLAPLQRFRVFNSNNRDQIRDALVEAYGASYFDARQANSDMTGTGSLLRLRDIDLGYLRFSADVQYTFPGAGLFRQQFVLDGKGESAFSGLRLETATNATGVIPPDAEASYSMYGDTSQIVLRVSEPALHSKFASLSGRAVARKFEFSTADTFDNPGQQRLRRLITFFVDEIDHGAEISDVVYTEFSQLLIVAFLTANKHNWTHLLEGEPVGAAPWQVRLVEEYLEANWAKPLTIEEIAQQTGVAVRSMFASFSRWRGYTPMAFLQHIRLRHARRLLQTPDEATSVAAVYLKCGFHNAGHFARKYRQAFSELPSVTLGLARRAEAIPGPAGRSAEPMGKK